MNQIVLLTIIAEEALAGNIETEITKLGAKGYTVSNVSGKGIASLRDNQWDGENVKIETLITDEGCQQILDYLHKKYMGKYAMIAFYQPVHVVRPEHFL